MTVRYPYQGDYPHQIQCNRCGRKFYTGKHSSSGTCRNCDKAWNIEMDEDQARDILDNMIPIFNIRISLPVIAKCGRIFNDLETLTLEHYFCNHVWVCRSKSECNNKLVAEEL
jgi:hypothetical protein